LGELSSAIHEKHLMKLHWCNLRGGWSPWFR